GPAAAWAGEPVRAARCAGGGRSAARDAARDRREPAAGGALDRAPRADRRAARRRRDRRARGAAAPSPAAVAARSERDRGAARARRRGPRRPLAWLSAGGPRSPRG